MKFIKQLVIIFTSTVLLACIFVLPVSSAAVTATAVTAVATQSAVLINGTAQRFEAYSINGNNYFKLRDLAYALRGTAKQFQVTFDDLTRQVDLTSLTAYIAIGDELAVSGVTTPVSAVPTPFEVYLDGVKLTLTAYVIGSANYIKLRDLAAAVNFDVEYVAESSTIMIDTAAGYTQPQAVATGVSDLNVTFIGDSIGVGLAPYLKKYYPNLSVDAKVSRQFTAAKSIIQQLLENDKLGPTVVIELGTNGSFTETQMRTVIELIGSDRKIVFVNTQVPRSWCAGVNSTLSKVSAEYTNTIIADWYTTSMNNSKYLYKDGVHPSLTGSLVLANIIADAIAEIQ